MAVFAFEARDAAGRTVRGRENASDEIDLDRLLQSRELLLVRTRPESRRTRRKQNTRTLIDFCYHLATVIEAGVPLLDGLRDLQEEGKSPIAYEVEDISRRVASGQQLSEAMDAHPVLFPELVRSLVGAGEETGSLDIVLYRLAAYLEWREDLRRKLISAATYPLIVVVGIIGLVVLLLTVVLPQFMEIFVELRVELPLPTRALLALDFFARQHGLHVLFALVVFGIGAKLYLRTESGRYRADASILRLPVFGKVVSMVEMSRLSHNLGVLYGAGIPITRALTLVAAIVQNRPIRHAIVEAGERIAQGETLTESLSRGDLMPRLVKRMIALGESSGRLDKSLERVAAYYDREVPEILDRVIALVNTGLIAVLGFTVGSVAFAIFVPMYRMLGNIND